MECSCGQAAIIGDPARCKEHFLEEFEKGVKKTIDEYELINPNCKIAVAASGGKDSLTVLSLLKKWHGDVTAIVVDEGIEGYREKTIVDLRRVCNELGIPIVVKSYKKFSGFTLDEMLDRKKLHPCTICGTLRRHLISVASKEFDVLATGHNADDESQTILMNLLRGNTDIFPRNGPKTGVGAVGFTQRIKPLYFCTEKEVATYAFLKGFVSEFVECPNASKGYRYLVREELNRYAQSHSGVKQRILKRFLLAKKQFPQKTVELPRCKICSEPSAKDICKACTFVKIVTN